MTKNLEYYDMLRETTYQHVDGVKKAEEHSHYVSLKKFIEAYKVADKKCLEIGSARGLFQNMVQNYTGTDIAASVAPNYYKPYKVMDETGRYPFDDESFDVIWTLAVYEHIPDLQLALEEILRLLRSGGLVYFAPAWQCRSWAAEGYPVRPYGDFGIKGKIIKASIPIRNSVLYRSTFTFPKRMIRQFLYLIGKRFKRIQYKKIEANWDHYWMSDADACNSIDPHDAILWFESNGFHCLSHPLHLRAFLVRTGGLVFKKI